jgi:hypothetical protein
MAERNGPFIHSSVAEQRNGSGDGLSLPYANVSFSMSDYTAYSAPLGKAGGSEENQSG